MTATVRLEHFAFNLRHIITKSLRAPKARQGFGDSGFRRGALVTAADETVWRQLWCAYLEFYKTSQPEEVYATTWARIMDPSEEMFSSIAEYNGQVIGLVNFLYHRSFWGIENRCYLNDLYVLPEIRGTGAGSKLIDAVVSHAKGRNSAAVYWLTAKDNVKARRLYDYVATLTPFVKYQV